MGAVLDPRIVPHGVNQGLILARLEPLIRNQFDSAGKL